MIKFLPKEIFLTKQNVLKTNFICFILLISSISFGQKIKIESSVCGSIKVLPYKEFKITNTFSCTDQKPLSTCGAQIETEDGFTHVASTITNSKSGVKFNGTCKTTNGVNVITFDVLPDLAAGEKYVIESTFKSNLYKNNDGKDNSNGVYEVIEDQSVKKIKTTFSGVCAGSANKATASNSCVFNTKPTISKGAYLSPTSCNGKDGYIKLTGLLPSLNYKVNFLQNGTQTSINLTSDNSGVLTIGNLPSGTYTSINVNLGALTSNTISDLITLNNPSLKTISKLSTSSPTTCGGSDGNITLTGFISNTVYGISFTKNGNVTNSTYTSNASGIIAIPNLSIGEYSNFYATLNQCKTNTIIDKYTLSNPILKTIAKSTIVSPTTCGGQNGSITLTGFNNSTAYKIFYTKNGVQISTSINSTSSGVILISNLTSGEYSNFYATLNGCSTNMISDKIVLSDPVLKSISKGTFTSPTTCAGSNGSIQILGLNPSTSYTLSYTKNNQVLVATLKSTSAGIVTVSNLTAGEYSNFSTSLLNCSTNTITDKITLVNPPLKTISKGTFTSPKSCSSKDGSINLTGFTANTIYEIDYTKNGVSSISNFTSTSAGVITITGLNAAEYSNFTGKSNGCITNTITDKITLLNPSSPSISKGNVVSPSSCNTFDGSIQINGLVKNTSYSLTYSKNNVTTSSSATSTSTGTLVISNLEAAQYSNIYVTLGGCMSNLISDNIILSNPSVPTLTKGLVSNTSSCSLKDGSIEIKGFDNSKSYLLNYKKNGVDTKSQLTSTNTGSIIITNLEPGTYTGFYTSVKSCSSNIINENILISNPINLTIGIENTTNTSGCISKDGSIQINGLGNNTTYSCKFSKDNVNNSIIANSNESGILTIANLDAGDYSNLYVAINGCISNTISDKISIKNPSAPLVSLSGSFSPSKCLNNDGSINFTTSALNSEHIVYFTKNGVNTSTTANSINSLLSLTNLEKGEYSNFYVQVNGCLSATITSKVNLTDPTVPTITKGNITNPSNCLLKDGAIELNGLSNNTNYTVYFSKNGIDNQSDFISDINGVVKIGNLEPAVYTNIKVNSLNCISNTLSDVITLSNPVTLTVNFGSFTNTSDCTKNDGTIQITGLDATTTYDNSYTKNGSYISSTITTDVNGKAIFTGLEPAIYSNFIFTLKGCNSNILSNGIQINTPSQPKFSISRYSNPTKCNAYDGSIILKSTTPNVNLTINFTKDDGDNSLDTKSIDSLITLTNLGEGNYSNFSISAAGCLSKVDTTLVNLIDPIIQNISIIKKSNPSTCVSNDGTIIIGGLDKSTNYTLFYNKNNYSIDTLITSNETGNILLSNLEIAKYSQFYVNTNDCNSNILTDTITFVNPVNTILSKTSSNNVSNCQLNDGSISFKGGQSGQTYQLMYSKDNTTFFSDVTASNNGILTLSNLNAGTYSLFKATINGCESNLLQDTLVISTPIAPSFNIKNQVSPITCGGNEGSIELSVESNNNYIVNYTKNGFYNTKTISSVNKSLLISNLEKGTYSNFYITLNGCNSSTNNSVVTLQEPNPAIISIKNYSNPVTCLTNDGKILLNGMDSLSNYTLYYSKNGNLNTNNVTTSISGELQISNLEPAIYTNFSVQKNNCLSNIVSDNITIKDPSSPILLVENSTSPTNCNGNDGMIVFNGLDKNIEYTITYLSPKGNSTNKISSSSTGSIALQNLTIGTYSNFSVSYNGCQSNTIIDLITLSNPSIPTISLGAVSSPSSCTSCNGSIEIKGLVQNSNYTVYYSRNNESESRTFTSDASGDGFISSLSEGTYTSFYVNQNNCNSNSIDTTIQITAKTTITSTSCSAILVNIEDNGVKNVSCSGINDGAITFTITNGSSNNLYRIRKKNHDGSYTVITYPAYSPVGNLQNETKTITFDGLGIGEYDLYAFCNEDPTKYNTKYFTIGKDTCSTPISYTCTDLNLILNKSDIVPASCNSDHDGSILFSVYGGFPGNLYRIRKKNDDGTFTVVTTPTFSPVNNSRNEIKQIIVNNLSMGDYDLYVYCANDVTKYKSLTFSIEKAKCTLVKTDMIAYYPFNGNAKDESGNNHDAVVTCVDLTMDNYNNPKGAYLLNGINDNITVKNLVDIDTLNGYSYSIWYKLAELPKNDESTLLSIPNGNSTNRLEIALDSDGAIRYNFGNGLLAKSTRSSIVSPVNTWNHITLTHDNVSNNFYFNGVLVASESAYKLASNQSDLVIGYNGSNKNVKATVDEIRVYKRAITETEVQTIYHNEAVENCSGIRLNIDAKSQANTLTFTVSNGSKNNKYRLRKKNDSGIFTSVYTPTYLSLNNQIGETKSLTITGLQDGIYDIYAYCGSDGTKYQGYQFVISNGSALIQTVTTPEGTINYKYDNSANDESAGLPMNELSSDSKFTIYPNPTDNFVYISTDENEIIKFVKVYNSNGQQVFEGLRAEDNLEKSINVSSWSSGSYILEIFLENKPSVKKNFILK